MSLFMGSSANSFTGRALFVTAKGMQVNWLLELALKDITLGPEEMAYPTTLMLHHSGSSM